MILCGIDIETTGLERDKDFVTELGYVIKKYGDPKPLAVVSELIKLPEGVTIPEEITRLTKITAEHLALGGQKFSHIMRMLSVNLTNFKVDYIVAHNGNYFDRPFLESCLKRAELGCFDNITGTPWLDTASDVPYGSEFGSKNLTYVCATLGFLNPFPHAAVFDANCCLKILEAFDINEVIARANEPKVIVRAVCMAPWDDKAPEGQKETDRAKALGFRWERAGDRHFPKWWVKIGRKSEFVEEQKTVPFPLVILEEV